MNDRRESGQALLIGVLLLLVLLMSIPAMIFLNQHATSHGVESQKRLRGRAIAEEGISYAIQQITNNGAAPLNSCAVFPATQKFQSAQKDGFFQISCVPPPGPTNNLQSYEIQIISQPMDTESNIIPGSSIQTILSQRTVGVKLPSGFAVSAAAELGFVPTVGTTSGDFRVHWGPIEITDPTTPIPVWSVVDSPLAGVQGMNAYQYPRKFSITPITEFGTANAALNTTDAGASLARCNTNCSCTTPTDEQEYWACTGAVFNDPIDTGTYKNIAQLETGITVFPTCVTVPGGTTDLPTPASFSNGHGYFDESQCPNPSTDRVLFDGSYTVPNNNIVIYVDNGDAQFNSIEMDFGGTNGGGAFIAAGNLFVNGTIPITAAPNQTAGIRQPPSYLQEYPYAQSGLLPTPTCPSVGCSCAAVANGAPCSLPFRGFLYVLGNMTLVSGSASDFVMSGVLRVDGLVNGVPTGPGLTVNDANKFRLYYDDVINHNIRTGSSNATTSQPIFEVQVDSTAAIP